MPSRKALFAFLIACAASLQPLTLARNPAPARRATDRTHSYRLSPSAQSALSRLLTDAVSRNDTPAVVALVVGPDRVLYQGAAGRLNVAKNIPIRTDAIFAIASMTKPVTSVAAMILCEDGKLKLDDPVSRYLTGFDHLRVITAFNDKDAGYQTRPAARPMTIRHLLTHTSGLAYAFSNETEHRLAELTKKPAWELPLVADPGARWIYGPSTRVLGMIVEKTSGESLETYFQKRIFQPLGMVDTSFAVPLAKQPRVASLHQRINGALQEQPESKIPSTPAPPFHGDGGLYSTAQDYGRFLQMLLNGGHLGSVKILSETSVRMMGENNIGPLFVELQPSFEPSLAKPFPLGAGRDKFGLGFELASDDPHQRDFRSPGSMSWAGVFNTEFWIDPLKRIAAVQMMQVLPFYDEGALRTLRDFEQLLYRNLK